MSNSLDSRMGSSSGTRLCNVVEVEEGDGRSGWLLNRCSIGDLGHYR